MKLISEIFGDRIRVRVCGLCYRNNSILLIKHRLDDGVLWAPPGGGINKGETINTTLIREFKEETNLDIQPGTFLFFAEFIKEPLHAIELFYSIDSFVGETRLGVEPEITDKALLTDIGYFNEEQLAKIPLNERHGILKICTNPIELLDYRGQIKY